MSRVDFSGVGLDRVQREDMFMIAVMPGLGCQMVSALRALLMLPEAHMQCLHQGVIDVAPFWTMKNFPLVKIDLHQSNITSQA
ncbi:hypothetical protein BFS14_19495 [Serratia fonticola]|uniref:hypothetical protein n=1 Tax=Serratia fonticola TaxID=47917 RepID=UPI0008FCE33F|nr:hypothetical protein [Serratia fonticola]OIX93105.1 hypothetical protein BFS14_19495 [Serratia fonticola]QCR63039.1 hypothetical protein FD644_23045 [Serratia fonticola]